MAFWVQLAILVITTLISYALAPKPPKSKPPSLEDFDVPTAESGRPIPVVFGEVTVTGPNVVWYGDLMVDTQTQNGVKYRYYYMGLHFAVCHGPVDSVSKILIADREAWTGSATTSRSITISNSSLFGGKKKEGGVSGTLAVMMGEAAQSANAYLVGKLGTPMPAYRGVLGFVFQQGYIGANTTYVKPWAFKVKRIMSGWYSDSCWYPETAEVLESETTISTTSLLNKCR